MAPKRIGFKIFGYGRDFILLVFRAPETRSDNECPAPPGRARIHEPKWDFRRRDIPGLPCWVV